MGDPAHTPQAASQIGVITESPMPMATGPDPRRKNPRRCIPMGDYAIMRIQEDGSLVPLSLLGRTTFKNAEDSEKWLREHANEVAQSGEDVKIAIIAFKRLLNLRYEVKQQATLSIRPRLRVNRETGDLE